jgi:poly(3-hydroxybutyrate) depolymerase
MPSLRTLLAVTSGLLYLVVIVGSLTTSVQAVGKLQSYNADVSETSVSGLSSGAFFAVQMQVAFSSIMKGAGTTSSSTPSLIDRT